MITRNLRGSRGQLIQEGVLQEDPGNHSSNSSSHIKLISRHHLIIKTAETTSKQTRERCFILLRPQLLAVIRPCLTLTKRLPTSLHPQKGSPQMWTEGRKNSLLPWDKELECSKVKETAWRSCQSLFSKRKKAWKVPMKDSCKQWALTIRKNLSRS